MPSFEFPNLSRWVLTLVKFSYSGTTKMNLFKMLDFQRIHFFKKRPWKCATHFAQPNCENKSFEPDHQIPSHCPIRRFLTMITNFFGSLKSKRRWLFRNNKLSLNIFWFQTLRKPRFQNKRNFWINCVCIKAFVLWYTHKGGICIHCIPTRGHSRHDILPSRHSYHVILSRRHLHSLHTQTSIRIHCLTIRTFASWHAP